MSPGANLFVLITVSLGVLTYLLVVVAAFRVSVGWGLLVLFVPFCPLIFMCKHQRKYVWWYVLGCGLYGGGMSWIYMHPEQFGSAAERSNPLLAILRHYSASAGAGKADQAQNQPQKPREAVDLAETGTPVSQRDELLMRQDAYAKHNAELSVTFAQLKAERDKIKGAGPALTAFNAKAAKYQEQLRVLAAEKASLDAAERTVAATKAAAAAVGKGNAPGQKLVASETAPAKSSSGGGSSAGGSPAEAPVTRQEMDAAVQHIRTIVNQVPPSVTKPREAESSTYTLHPGAVKPDFDKADIVGGRQVYSEAYIQMNGAPNVFYRGSDCEFNTQTKFFYTQRELPKKRLSEAEIADLVRLYRYVGKCERELGVKL